MKQSFFLVFILLVVLSIFNLSSCNKAAPLANDLDPETTIETPIDILTPNSSLVMKFYAWEDGSAGVLEESDGSLSYSFDEKLEDATPAEIYWACSKPGKEVPAMLVAHHDDVASSGGFANFSNLRSANKQGWALEEGQVRGTPCLNSTFRSKHCNHPNYPDGGPCYTNISNGKEYESAEEGTRRFKAGFCLQDGRAADVLSYSIQCSPSNNHIVWGDFFNPYNAQTYRTWTWIAGTYTQSRNWRHTSVHWGNATFDWANMARNGSICVQ